ncbi:unnamed protein product [Ostreobium quekettii]|uniref:Uncharacterized protein n=1 Tax=Ostreobium quekettii TaxID=121088 RepID=A0A8S1J113_9CHLO|nr:unnamed protein product [Ostreobium quekettii]
MFRAAPLQAPGPSRAHPRAHGRCAAVRRRRCGSSDRRASWWLALNLQGCRAKAGSDVNGLAAGTEEQGEEADAVVRPESRSEATQPAATHSEASPSGAAVVTASANGATSSPSQGSTSEGHEAWLRAIPKPVMAFWSDNPSMQLLHWSRAVLQKQFLPVVFLTLLNSATRFGLVWVLYQILALGAVHIFGVPPSMIPKALMPTAESPGDPGVYSRLADATFLLFKPLDFLLKGLFLAATLVLCREAAEAAVLDGHSQNGTGGPARLAASGTQPKEQKWWARVWSAGHRGLGAIRNVAPIAVPVTAVHIVVGAFTALYQGCCLLLLPIVFAMRRLLNIQLALTAAVFEGETFKTALDRSKQLVEPLRPGLYLPFIFLFATPKILGMLRDLVIQTVPERLFAEVPELTWSLVAVLTVAAFLLDRMNEVLPVVVYTMAKRCEDETKS